MPAKGYRDGLEFDVVWDHGDAYVGNTYWGTSRGGLRFSSNKEVLYPEHDGMSAQVEGLHRTGGWDARISGTFFFSRDDRLKWLEPGLQVTAPGGNVTSRKLPKDARELYDRLDYIEDLRMVGYGITAAGAENIEQVRFPKALCTTYEIVGQDKDVWIVTAEFVAVLDKDDAAVNPNQCPFVFETLTALS